MIALAAAVLSLLLAVPGKAGATLDSIRLSCHVQCAVSTGVARISRLDSQGVWRGFDADICCAMATTGCGDAAKLRFIPTTAPTQRGFVKLPDIIFKEPHGVLVRNGDPESAAQTRRTVFALIQTEKMGLTRKNVAGIRASTQEPTIHRLLGVTENVGTGWALPASWTFEGVRQTVKFSGGFQRGPGAVLVMERGPNRPWTEGGPLISWLRQ